MAEEAVVTTDAPVATETPEAPTGTLLDSAVTPAVAASTPEPTVSVAPPSEEIGSLVDDDGITFVKNWSQQLAKKLGEADPRAAQFLEDKTLASTKTIPDLANQLIHTIRKVGADTIIPPTEKSTPEEWQAYHKAGGMPDVAQDYKIEYPEILEVTDDKMKAANNEFFHSEGLSNKQAQAMVNFDAERRGAAVAAAKEAADAERMQTAADLKTEWGNAHDQKLLAVYNLAKNLELTETIEKLGLGNNKDFIKMLDVFASRSKEDSSLVGAEKVLTPKDASKEINDILGDLSDPYHNPKHPQNKARIQYVTNLFAQKG